MAIEDDTRAVQEWFRPGHRLPRSPIATAWDLWRELDIASQRWSPCPARKSMWVFRGQADAEWTLLPSAWRVDGRTGVVVMASKHRIAETSPHLHSDPVKLQFHSEMALVKEFADVGARDGYPLPPDVPGGGKLPRAHDEIVALAQHFGVPTRQLDFSRDPRVAMFWALHGEPGHPDSPLTIWALRTDSCRYVRFLHHARWRNPNLLAQDGVSAVIPMEDHFLRVSGRLPSLEEFKGVPDEALVRFDLPRSEAAELGRLLEVAGVTWSRLTPGFAGVARTVIARHVPRST